MNEEQLQQVKELLADALYTDGEHHKQWYLWQIADALQLDLPDTEEKEVPQGFLEKATQEAMDTFTEKLKHSVEDMLSTRTEPRSLAFVRQELIHLTAQRHALDERYTALSDELRKADFRLSYDDYAEEYVLSARPACNEDDMNDKDDN